MGKENLNNNDRILDGAKRLNDDALAGVSGGAVNATDNIGNARGIARNPEGGGANPNLAGGVQRHYCIKCKKDTAHKVYSGGRLVCEICGTSPTL